MPKFFILVLVIILVAIFAFNKNATPPKSTDTKSDIPIQIQPIIYQAGTEFSQISKDYPASTITYPDNSFLWWISKDGYNIINDNSPTVSLNLSCPDQNPQPLKQALSKAIPAVSKIFQNNGFTLNKTNSSISLDDDRFYDYIQAFEKDDIYCTLVGDPDCSGNTGSTNFYQTISVTCTNQFAKNYQDQIPYLSDLNIKDGVIHLATTYGDFVYIAQNFRRTGHYIIAKKENSKWVKLIEGQDVPSCETVNKERVPHQIMEECYSAAQQKTLPNTN
ncbi:MAG: hypothetical protein WCV81_00170 [Microgenomates group bacterium]|jgi:hypothetical protein